MLVILSFRIIGPNLMSCDLFILVFAWIGHNADTLCTSKNCIRAASNLLQSMDFTANPCTDFYQLTCGNWAEDHPR